MPDGGGVGSGRARAGRAQSDAKIAVDNILVFKDFLRGVGDARWPDHRVIPAAVKRREECSRKTENRVMTDA
jgi:hypothetical protein